MLRVPAPLRTPARPAVPPDKEAGIGVIAELAEGAFTEAELRAAAESVNVIAPR